MPPHVCDQDAIRILSAAMEVVCGLPSRPLGKDEIAKFSKLLTENLLAAFDLGEREPAALHRAANEGSRPSRSLPDPGIPTPILTHYRVYDGSL
jgi:hypothetical protein